MSPAQSPYEAALGDRFGLLHPRLRSYFSAIPSGSVGVGEGVFDTVGTPRGWLRPFIRLLADPDVLFPVWERDVSFTVANTPVQDAGRPAVAGERTFRLTAGGRTMRDLIVATPDGLVDILGARRRFRALFAARVVDGGLRLESTRVAVRIRSRQVVIPGPIAPRVRLTERFSESDDRQHVEVTVTLPLIGRVYEYAGSFRYELGARAA
ncbi:MAG TPA: DUF4166 domain-containing protein [Terrimesophilobacter sp.]|nr:DUF4166 domain-containing protein [Terrimesophilobacter sp.]